MIESLHPAFSLVNYNQIPVLEINHSALKAKISLQGAQLLSWQPSHCEQDVLWLSEIEPFELGTAIRGGVPICYPWFGGVKQPSHGFARIQLWELTRAEALADSVIVALKLGDLATIEMKLGQTCELIFTQLSDEPAQLALHSYFNVADIQQVALHHLPTESFNSLTQRTQAVSSPRYIDQQVDEIYAADHLPTVIADSLMKREISVAHHNASEIVVWNPWHKTTSGMAETGYQTMVCVETARIHRVLNKGEQVSVSLSVTSR